MKMNVGEHFILGFSGMTLPTWIRAFADRFGLGGVILFDYDCQQRCYERNIASPRQLQTLCAELNSLPAKPLIFIDQEGGKVCRLKSDRGFIAYPSAKEFSQLPWLRRVALTQAAFAELRTLGIHYNLAPLIDFAHTTNPNIGALGRAYAADVATIQANVGILHRAAVATNLGLCLKHYPGIGAAIVDSHRHLMQVAINPTELTQFHRLGTQIHGQAILLSHALVQDEGKQEWDNQPVSLSKQAVQRLRALCPSSLLITDDLQMQGIQLLCDTSVAVRQGLLAGVDMVIIGNNLCHEEDKAVAWAQALATQAKQNSSLHTHLRISQQRIAARKDTHKV